MSEKKIGVAVIGAGNFARRQHLPNLHRIREAQLVSICDTDLETAREAAVKYDIPHTETDYRKVLDSDAVEVVVIAVRDDLQAVIAMEALNAGKHVYVEKPLSADPEICRRTAQVARSSKMRLAVGFNKRFAPIYRTAAEVMNADSGPRNLHLRMADDAWRWAVGYPPGHLLAMDVCHFFDLLRWFTGAEVSSVYGISARPEDYCLAVRMTNGTTASILFSGHGTMDMPKERIDAVCTRGGISAIDYVELHTYGYQHYRPVYTFAGHTHPEGEFGHRYLMERLGSTALDTIRRGVWELREGLNETTDEQSPYLAESTRHAKDTIPNFLRDQGWLASMQAFLKGILTGEPTDHATAEDAAAASAATRAAEESIAGGRPVTL